MVLLRLGLCVMFLAGGAAGGGPAGWSRHEVGGITIALPARWSVESGPGTGVIHARQCPPVLVNSGLSVSVHEARTTFDRWVEFVRTTDMPAQFPGARVVSEGPLAGMPHPVNACHLTGLGGANKGYDLLQGLVWTKRHAVAVNFLCDSSRVPAYEPLFREMLQSITESAGIGGPATAESGATGTQGPLASDQIRWEGNLRHALEQARESGLPILVAFNMDGEGANDDIARNHYRDPEIVKLSRRMVCLVGSTA